MLTRIEKLRELLPEDFGAALIQHRPNRAYLSKFMSSAGLLLITAKSATLFVDFRYIEVAKIKTEGVDVILMDRVYDQIGQILAGEGVSALLLENEISVGTLASVKKGLRPYKPKIECGSKLSRAVARLRAVKDEEEIDRIRAAQKITDDAFAYICGFIKEGRTEREVAAELEYFMRRNGADGLAFGTICVSGKNTSMPHGEPGEKKLERGDFITMDFGAMKNDYCSDMTRTVALGEISDEQKRVYDTVLTAHLTAMRAARAGVTGFELDKAARDVVNAAGYEGCFGHGLGHSLGLEIHENPRASQACRDRLPAGTVVTIEPGIYLEGRFGVRIENMVVLTDEGCVDLTASPRELICL